jgi:hypothetical protein
MNGSHINLKRFVANAGKWIGIAILTGLVVKKIG